MDNFRQVGWPFTQYLSGENTMGVKRKKGVRANFGGSTTTKSIGGKILAVLPANGRVTLTHEVNGQRYQFTPLEVRDNAWMGKPWPRHPELNSSKCQTMNAEPVSATYQLEEK